MDSFLRWFRRLGIPLAGVLFFLALVIVYPEKEGDTPAWGSISGETLAALLLGVGVSYLTFETGIMLSRYLDRHLTWALHPLRRVLLQVSLQTILALTVTLAVGLLYVRLGYNEVLVPVSWADLMPLLLVGLFVAFLLSGAHIGASFFNYWQLEIIAREAATAQAAQARLEALQQQIDPHFLFNTLNTLTAVIEVDPPRAVTFVQRLATVYRYVLQHQHTNRVGVLEELRLARAYLYLLQTRYPDGLQVDIAVAEEYYPRLVLPMVLQLLLENAVKHNRIEPDAPLLIRIYVRADRLVVENNRQPLPHPVPSTGLGLRNVARRYEAVGVADPLQIAQTPDLFRVSIPLLNTEEPAPAPDKYVRDEYSAR